MLKIAHLEKIEEITGLLANTLSSTVYDGMPPDVATALLAAKKQMESLPEVIEDLNAAFTRYLRLNTALKRMVALSYDSSQLGEGPDDAEQRRLLEEEFISLANVVALEAGHRYFKGPTLSVANRISAIAASKVLSYLKPVLEKLDFEIRGQKSLIVEAIAETMNFMGVITKCYPKAPGIDIMRQTLEKVKLPADLEAPVSFAPTFH
ncbi:MAG: hypothetical protein LBT62_04175 [Deltaproteobacteria bacterium]|jgi:hypothetical protein|nr:hypothetical protein [Deltaproteobacteria bacterium]